MCGTLRLMEPNSPVPDAGPKGQGLTRLGFLWTFYDCDFAESHRRVKVGRDH